MDPSDVPCQSQKADTPILIQPANVAKEKECIQQSEPKQSTRDSNDKKITNIDNIKVKQLYGTRYVPDTNLTLACLVCVCFNLPLGLLAMYHSITAARFYKDGDPKQGERMAKCSVVISLFSIVTTVLLVMSYVLWISVETQNKWKL
ncbi:hypothetical protein DPMN_191773 [Dreissena polymorpha]|uniref:Uncharacterized protein n=1 Tax=Dreissena polymorpha TaxID=45954 RepID=A0A9D3XZN0_DREPO|nr:hypothetical protein DPMN_191773 [Dreissena polymorpha]